MNVLSDIISNAMDLAGGAQLDFKLNAAALYAMNVVADMENELAHSTRGRQILPTAKILTANARVGTSAILPDYIRFRAGLFSRWEIIPIVSDIEDLTIAENWGEKAVLFTGSNPYDFILSFAPDQDLTVEFYGSQEPTEPTGLGDSIKIPAAYTHLAANRTAFLLLDDVLLIQNNPALIQFVQSRKSSLIMRQRDLEHRWTVYRSCADVSQSEVIIRPYDPFLEEYGSVFEIS